MPRRKVVCYVDGFNLYHGINDLQMPHLKWVDLQGLSASFVRDTEELVKVRYFSAFATWLKHQYPRHSAYVKALESRGVQCVMAHFKQKQMRCRTCGATWVAHEEKETDVRVALSIFADAEDDTFERAIIISGDSDLVPVVQAVRQRHPRKNITIATPPGRFNSSRDLRAASGGQGIEITKGRIKGNLLPKEIKDGAGNLVALRPAEYAPPS